MKKYLISSLALSSILVFGACSELEESEEEEVPEESEGTAEAEEEEEQPLSPEELTEEVFGDDHLLQNEYNEDENVLSVDVDFGDPWLYGRAQSNAESDMTELLEELAALDPVPTASFNFIGEVEDIEGNESEDSALLYEFESETVSSIDYEEFDSDESQETADHYWSHEEELEAAEEAAEWDAETIDYELYEVDDSNIANAVRLNYYAVPDDVFEVDEEAIDAISEEVINDIKEEEDFNTLVIFYVDDERAIDAGAGYTLGRAQYLPNGELGDAIEYDAGDYSDHELTIDYGSPSKPLPKDEEEYPTEEQLDMYFYWDDLMYEQELSDQEGLQMTAEEFDVSEEEAEEAITVSSLR